jgi:hypothetical protein
MLVISTNLFAHELVVKLTLSPAGSFEAKTNKLRGEIKKEGTKFTSEVLSLKIEDLKTGIDLRDEHFHKHLNFDKSPKITLNKVVAENGKGKGLLQVNEVSSEVQFTYKNLTEKKIEASFKVKPSTFKLKEAKYLEIGVDDEVEIVAIMDI